MSDMNREEYLQKRKSDAIQIATDLLNRAIDPIVAFRNLISIGHDFEEIREFDVFRGLDSETDQFPRGESRQGYSKSYLEKLDLEADEYLEKSRKVIEEACNALIKVLS